jgi:hypothetical protein
MAKSSDWIRRVSSGILIVSKQFKAELSPLSLDELNIHNRD